jgi:hypothetical protein
MIEIDIRADQFMYLMQCNIGFADVNHDLARLKAGDKVCAFGFVFAVREVVRDKKVDRVWLKKVAN